jgi:hypothetical protein
MSQTMPLLRAYLAQRGLYARVARQLGLDPSYVSRVANGKRQNKAVSLTIEGELSKLHTSIQKIAQHSGKKSAFTASR